MTFLPFQKLSTETYDCASDSQVSLMTSLRADDRKYKRKKKVALDKLCEKVNKCQGRKNTAGINSEENFTTVRMV